MMRRREWALGALVMGAMVLGGCGSKNKTTEQPTTTATSAGDTSAAPSGKDAAKRDKALVRFVNAVPGGPVYDLWFGDKKFFSSVQYKSITPYDELPGERAEFRLRAAGEDTAEPLDKNSEGLSDGKRYTIVAMPKNGGGVTLKANNDDLSAPPAGKAKVRVVHAAPGIGEVDVMPAGNNDAMFGGVNVDTTSSYKNVDPFGGTLEVRRNKRVAFTISNVKMDAGKIYTIVVLGGGQNKVDALVVEDQLARSANLP